MCVCVCAGQKEGGREARGRQEGGKREARGYEGGENRRENKERERVRSKEASIIF